MSTQAPAPEKLARFNVSPARRRRDRIARGTILAATVLALIPLLLIIYYLLNKGLSSWSTSFFTTDPTGNTFFGGSNIGGIKSAILGTIEIVALASAIEAIHLGSTNVDRAYYGTDTRAYQLLAGALLALTPELMKLGTRFLRTARWTAPLALGGIVLFGSSALGTSAIWRGVFAAIQTAALIMALEGSPTSVVGRGLSNDRVSYLGRISYATYLWHWPLIVLITHNNHIAPLPLFLITAVGASVLAAISYHFLEHPIRSSRSLDSYRVPVIAVGLTISAVCGLVIAPAILRWNTGGTANARSLSVSVPSLQTGTTKLLDWRIARNDIPALPSCFGKPVDRCTVVRGTGPSVLLVGDSLARMWLPAFRAIAKRESLTLSVAALPSCPWQQDIKHRLAMVPQCPGNRADWYTRVIPELHPNIIFLAERGFDKPGNPFQAASTEGLVGADSPAGERTLVDASSTGIQSLRAAGRKIVILDATPLPPDVNFNPVSCLSTGSHSCGFRVSTALTKLDEFYREEARQPDIFNLDLDRLACPRLPLCDPIVNDIIVRRDHTHLTGTYARALSTTLEALLHQEGILSGRG